MTKHSRNRHEEFPEVIIKDKNQSKNFRRKALALGFVVVVERTFLKRLFPGPLIGRKSAQKKR